MYLNGKSEIWLSSVKSHQTTLRSFVCAWPSLHPSEITNYLQQMKRTSPKKIKLNLHFNCVCVCEVCCVAHKSPLFFTAWAFRASRNSEKCPVMTPSTRPTLFFFTVILYNFVVRIILILKGGGEQQISTCRASTVAKNCKNSSIISGILCHPSSLLPFTHTHSQTKWRCCRFLC